MSMASYFPETGTVCPSTVAFTGFLRSPHTISTYSSDVGCHLLSCSHSHTYPFRSQTFLLPFLVVNAPLLDAIQPGRSISLFLDRLGNLTPTQCDFISKSTLRRPPFSSGGAMSHPVHTVQDRPSQYVIGWDSTSSKSMHLNA
mgnify:CR=1 FL=1